MSLKLKNKLKFVVPEESANKRVDCMAREILRGLSLRACRRMIAERRVLINSSLAHAAYRVKKGDVIEIIPEVDSADVPMPKEIEIQGSFHFFYKPPGLHTVHLNGGSGKALEDFLPQTPSSIQLLQRLDFFTSGLICGTADPESAAAFRKSEKSGQCRKRYLAVLSGHMHKEIEVRNELDTAGGRKVRVRKNDGNPLHWTRFRPLPINEGLLRGIVKASADYPLTLVQAVMNKGQRHQIRAHASACGYPLYGDILYGAPKAERYFLHNYFLGFPGYSCRYVPEDSWASEIPTSFLAE